MKIFSPYGKDVQDELSRIYGIQSLKELQQRVKSTILKNYGFTVVRFEALHIAFCMNIHISTNQGKYYLKFIGKGITQTPNDLLHYITYLREHDIPLPAIIPTQSGDKFFSMLPDTTYETTILMSPAKGHPIPCKNTLQIQNFAKMLAKFHQLGIQYAKEHGTYEGGEASRFPFYKRIPKELPDMLADGLAQHASLLNDTEKSILKNAHQYVLRWCMEEVSSLSLEKTHIHGDIRMCHVFEKDNAISGIIDFDQSCYAERLIDICFGMISAPTQNDGKILDLAGQQFFLNTYHTLNPLTESEQNALHPFLLWANLEQFWDMCDYHIENPEHVTLEKLRRNIEEIDQLMAGNIFQF